MVDCGANLGLFSTVMLERFGAKVFAFEASPPVFAELSRIPGLVARNVAVCGEDGPVRLAISNDITRTAVLRQGHSEDATVVEVQGCSLPRLLHEAKIVGAIEVLKLDIEGAELAVIDSMPDELLLSIGQITIEFHEFLGYHTAADVDRRVERILALGFREFFWSRTRNSGDVLLVNAARVSRVRHLLEQKIVRPVRALNRKVARAVMA